MSSARAIRLVTGREIRERLRSREFRWSTAITVLIVVGIVGAIGLLSDPGPARYDVAVVGQPGVGLGAEIQEQAASIDAVIVLRDHDDADRASAAVEAGELDAAVTAQHLIAHGGTPDELIAIVQTAAERMQTSERLRESGVAADEVRAALDPPGLAAVEVGKSDPGGEGLALLVSLLLFIAILGFGTYLTTGVVEEKTSRVVELIVAAIRPAQLLSGKVIGIGVLGLCQVIVVVLAALATAAIVGGVELPEGTPDTIALAALYFALGYLLYAWAFAVAGAIVSRAEDVQTTTGPLTLILLTGYVVVVNLVDAPGSTAAQILTFVPLTAPLIAPVRAAQGALPTWELALSVVLVFVAIAGLAWLATRIYERAVLHTSAPLKLHQAFRLLR